MAKRLGSALSDAIAAGGVSMWERFRYWFDFAASVYRWNGKNIALTDTEALYLYERLVAGTKQCETVAPQTVYQLQRKFGKAFLAELFRPGEKKRRGPGRKTDLEYEVEGNWFTKDGRPRFRG
jgi:hypothetical protein